MFSISINKLTIILDNKLKINFEKKKREYKAIQIEEFFRSKKRKKVILILIQETDEHQKQIRM